MKETELLDAYIDTNTETPLQDSSTVDKSLIGFRNASFVWSLASVADGYGTPSRFYRLDIRGELFFKPNCVNLIIGPT